MGSHLSLRHLSLGGSMVWVAFITGLVLGTITGITIMGMITVARRADDDLDNLKYRRAGRRFLRR